tara:strand:+ start:10359 stop:10643 length:285 start_codon:yes stop_codon:yes gene_type:complete
MEWFNLLKAKGDGKLNFIVRWGLTDEFASVEQILFRMKESGKHQGQNYNHTSILSQLKKLERRDLAESRIDETSYNQEGGFNSRVTYSFRLKGE